MVKYILISILFLFFITGCSHRFETNPYTYKQDQPNETIHFKSMKLTKVQFHKLDGWNVDKKKGSLEAFTRGCQKNRTINIEEICKEGYTLKRSNPNNREITDFFENYFIPYKIIDKNKGSSKGLVTGYYVPLLNGSLKKTKKYRYPIYEKPKDFKLPYLTHKEIDQKGIDAKVICWVDDRVDRFFLHIQGSGTIKLRDGSLIGIGYAEKNGYPYTSIGTYIHRKFKVPLYKLSAGYIKKWIRQHPKKADEVLFSNKSFIFFVKQKKYRAIGAMGTNLVPKSTIAIDTTHIPLGSPIYIKSANPKDPVLNHLFMAQDRGGAIKGIARADLFFGFGDSAEKSAGTMKREGEFYMLVPKGYKFY